MDRQIRALSEVMRALLWSLVVNKEINQRKKLSNNWLTVFQPSGHEVWIMTKDTVTSS